MARIFAMPAVAPVLLQYLQYPPTMEVFKTADKNTLYCCWESPSDEQPMIIVKKVIDNGEPGGIFRYWTYALWQEREAVDLVWKDIEIAKM